MTASPPLPVGPAMLVIGHPGHELRVHGWLERARPTVMVLTDGSGSGHRPRLASTTRVLERAGTRTGGVYGRLTDAGFYRALIEGNHAIFENIVDEIASALSDLRIACVAGDAAEGYNPAHDVCRLLIDAAVERARARQATPIANLEFALMQRPGQTDPLGRPTSRLRLDAAGLERKLRAARDYPEMDAEVASAVEAWGEVAFGVEAFVHLAQGSAYDPGPGGAYYERYGETRVASGAYAHVIRYSEHVRPLADALAGRHLPAAAPAR